MKHNLLLGILIIYCSLLTPGLNAQDKLTIGPQQKHTSSAYWADCDPIVKTEQGIFYLLVPFSEIINQNVLAGNNSYGIGLLNNKLEFEKSVDIETDYKSNDAKFEEVVVWNNEIWVFSSLEQNDKLILRKQKFDQSSFQLSGEPENIISIDLSNIKYDKHRFNFIKSPDKSLLLLHYNLQDRKDRSLENGFYVFDKGFNIKERNNKSFGEAEKIYILDQYRIANDGKVYLLSRVFDDKKALKKSVDLEKTNLLSSTQTLTHEANYTTQLTLFHAGKVSTSTLNIPNQFLINSDFIIENDYLLLAGFYGQAESALPFGSFTMKLNRAGKILQTDKKVLPESFRLPSDISDKSNGLITGEDQYADYRFVIKNILKKDNGEYILSAERTVNQVKKRSSGNSVTYISVDHTDDIAVLDINKDLKIKNLYKIEKAQESESLSFLFASYLIATKNNNTYLVYTNIGKSNTTFTGNMKNTQAYLTKISENGEVETNVLFTEEEKELTLKACNSAFIEDDGRFILYGQENQRKYSFIEYEL